MKEKKISVRLRGEELESVEFISHNNHISSSEAIRLFIRNEKIVVIKEFERLIPVLADLTMLIEKDDCANYNEKIKEGVDCIWKTLNSLIQEPNEV